MWKRLVRIIVTRLVFGRRKRNKPRRNAEGLVTGRERVLT